MILTNRTGKGTPASFVCGRENVSGTASSLRRERRTSVKLLGPMPTRTLNSFMLHGCSEGGVRFSFRGGSVWRVTFVVLPEGR